MMVTSPIAKLKEFTRSQTVAISRGWWVLLLTGALGLVGGTVIFFFNWNAGALVVFVGSLLIIRGAFTAFSIPVDGSLRSWSLVLGLVEVFVGIGVFVWPGPTLLMIALAVGWLLLFRGTMAVAGSITGRRFMPYWGLVLVTGILEILVAIYLLGRPGLTLVALVFAIGFTSMLYGILEIVIAFEVKNLPKAFDRLTGDEEFDHSTLDTVS